MVELKMWKNKSDPMSPQHFLDLLDGPQIYVIKTEFWGRGIACPILALSKRVCARAWIYRGDEAVHSPQPWQYFALEFASKQRNEP